MRDSINGLSVNQCVGMATSHTVKLWHLWDLVPVVAVRCRGGQFPQRYRQIKPLPDEPDRPEPGYAPLRLRGAKRKQRCVFLHRSGKCVGDATARCTSCREKAGLHDAPLSSAHVSKEGLQTYTRLNFAVTAHYIAKSGPTQSFTSRSSHAVVPLHIPRRLRPTERARTASDRP